MTLTGCPPPTYMVSVRHISTFTVPITLYGVEMTSHFSVLSTHRSIYQSMVLFFGVFFLENEIFSFILQVF